MAQQFVIRANERNHAIDRSEGRNAAYVSGRKPNYVSRESSFNFHDFQSGRPGFGAIRVFGDEIFHGEGCGYNMHPHHNFVICAFVLEGELTHINTAGRGVVDQLRQGDYYVFSAGSGGKHSELSIGEEDMHAIYLWLMPNKLYLPTTYHRAHFDFRRRRNRIVQLIGDSDDALPVPQDVRVSRLVTDRDGTYTYTPRSVDHGTYVFVKEGQVRCGDVTLGPKDSLGISGVENFECVVADTSDVFFVETVLINEEARVEARKQEYAAYL
ncbi:pirin family protein [Paraburkholderia sp. C35]|uniref:pirin family protein n=1 Tax=Paraburkholderia sp. C35 TaxID=2126993 RepID=UPI000D68ACAB|nr:pirin family protein [Paraburkholderia sp. C35]